MSPPEKSQGPPPERRNSAGIKGEKRKLPPKDEQKVSKSRKWEEKDEEEECVVCAKIFPSSQQNLKSTQQRLIKYLLDEIITPTATPTIHKPKLTLTSLSRLHLCPNCVKNADLLTDYKAQLNQLHEDIGDLSQNFKTLAGEAIKSGPIHSSSEFDGLVHQIRNFIGQFKQVTETCNVRSSSLSEVEIQENKVYYYLSSEDDFDMDSGAEINPAKTKTTEPDLIHTDKETPIVETLNAEIVKGTCGGVPGQNFPFEEEIKIEVIDTNDENSASDFCPFVLEEGAAIESTLERVLIKPERVKITDPILRQLKNSFQTIPKPQIHPVQVNQKPISGQSHIHTSKKTECETITENPDSLPSVISDKFKPLSQMVDKLKSDKKGRKEERPPILSEVCGRQFYSNLLIRDDQKKSTAASSSTLIRNPYNAVVVPSSSSSSANSSIPIPNHPTSTSQLPYVPSSSIDANIHNVRIGCCLNANKLGWLGSLIQDSVDGTVKENGLSDRLHKEHDQTCPEQCHAVLLKKNLTHLRNALANNEMAIEGIRSPSQSSLGVPSTPVTALIPQKKQIKPAVSTPKTKITPVISTAISPPSVTNIIPSTPMIKIPPKAAAATTPQLKLPMDGRSKARFSFSRLK